MDDVHELLEEHNGKASTGQNPRPEAVHFVGARQLESGCAVGAGEELSQQRPVDLRSGLDIIYNRSLQEGRRQCWRGKGEQIEGDKEELVGSAADEEENLFYRVSKTLQVVPKSDATHPVRVVEIQDPASVLVHLLVALIRSTHDKCGIHVDVVTGEVQRDQALEDDGPPREG